MRKGNILNSEIISVLSKMGHTDKICIADAGLPIPDHVKRIDLSLIKGMPSFMDTLQTVLSDYECESYILAEEIEEYNTSIHHDIQTMLKGKKALYVNHEEFKMMLHDMKAVIRTGECTPYANIILESGVIF